MEIKDGVIMAGLQFEMWPVLKAAEDVWRSLGRDEGVTVTSALDGTHSAGSMHYYGYALDFRTRYFTPQQVDKAYAGLIERLPQEMYTVIVHTTHIHVHYRRY